jgi:hypothetical protein
MFSSDKPNIQAWRHDRWEPQRILAFGRDDLSRQTKIGSKKSGNLPTLLISVAPPTLNHLRIVAAFDAKRYPSVGRCVRKWPVAPLFNSSEGREVGHLRPGLKAASVQASAEL